MKEEIRIIENEWVEKTLKANTNKQLFRFVDDKKIRSLL